ISASAPGVGRAAPCDRLAASGLYVPAGTFPAGTLPAGTLPAVRPRTGPRRRPPPAVGLTGGTNRPGGTGRAGPLGSPAGAGRPGGRAGQRGGDPGRLRLGVPVHGGVRARR